MADAEPDVAQLSAEQRESLQTFIAVTNAEPSAAIPLLQRSQWNVNVSSPRILHFCSAAVANLA